jgi:hypothetical protein
MRSKFVLSTLAVGIIATMSLSTPASAQYGPGYGPPAYGRYTYGPVYAPRAFPRAYYYGEPVIGPLFYGDGWVPEPIFDRSRTGGIDPNIRPPG